MDYKAIETIRHDAKTPSVRKGAVVKFVDGDDKEQVGKIHRLLNDGRVEVVYNSTANMLIRNPSELTLLEGLTVTTPVELVGWIQQILLENSRLRDALKAAIEYENKQAVAIAKPIEIEMDTELWASGD
jgi:hypothetical protein